MGKNFGVTDLPYSAGWRWMMIWTLGRQIRNIHRRQERMWLMGEDDMDE